MSKNHPAHGDNILNPDEAGRDNVKNKRLFFGKLDPRRVKNPSLPLFRGLQPWSGMHTRRAPGNIPGDVARSPPGERR